MLQQTVRTSVYGIRTALQIHINSNVIIIIIIIIILSVHLHTRNMYFVPRTR
jgi:hypothetical protein